MKIKSPILSKLLCFSFIFVIIVSSCEQNGFDANDPAMFDWGEYTIVVPTTGLPTVKRVFEDEIVYLKKIKSAIADVSGIELASESGACDTHTHEIIIGDAERQEVQILKEQYHERDYIVSYKDGDFIIWGGSETSLIAAMDEFIAMIPEIDCNITEGDLIKHIEDYIPVYINGTDIKMYSFSNVSVFSGKSPSNVFCENFYDKYGYSLKKNAKIYEAYIQDITQKGSLYIVFGKGKDFSDEMPDVESGTAAIIYNGSSIMIYSGDKDGADILYKYLFKLFDDAETLNGGKYVELKYGVTYVTLNKD